MKIIVETDQFANVWSIRCEVGATVEKGDVLMVLESMKMEIAIMAPTTGKVVQILVSEGDIVEEDQALVELEG
jgi:biotin carboxyl carrier protein